MTFLTGLLLTGCVAYHDAKVMVPADVVLPGNVKELAVVSAASTEDANLLIDGVSVGLNRSPWFKVREIAKSQLAYQSSDSSIPAVCRSVGAHAVVAMAELSSNKATHSVAVARSSSFVSGDIADTEASGAGVAWLEIDTVTAHWVVYDCTGAVLTTRRIRAISLGVLRRDSVWYLVPHVRHEERAVHTGLYALRDGAYDEFQAGRFDLAATTWASAADGSPRRRESRLLHNAAVAYEAAGRLEKALRTALVARDLHASDRTHALVDALQGHVLWADELGEQEASRAK